MPERLDQLAFQPETPDLTEFIEAIPLSAALINSRGDILTSNLMWAENLKRFGANQVFVRPHKSWPPEILSNTPLYEFLTESLERICSGTLKHFDHCALAEYDRDTYRLDVNLTPFTMNGHRFALLCINISQETAWKDNLFENENRQSQIMNALSEGVMIQDQHGQILDCNQAAETILGLTRGQMLGRYNTDPRWGTIYEDGSPCPPQEYPSTIAMETGRSVNNFIMGVTIPDGGIHWLRISSRPIFQPQSDHPHITATTFVNITEEKRRQQELQELSERLQLALRAGDIGIWELNLQTGELIWDDVMHQIFKVDKQDFEGVFEDWSKRVHPEDIDEASRLLQGAIDNHSIFNGEFRIIWPDNQVRHIATHAIVRTDEAGRNIRFNGMNTDITDIRNTEKKLLDRSIELEHTRDRLQLAMNLEEIGVWQWDFEQNILECDDGLFKLYGLKREDFNSTIDAWRRILHPADTDNINSVFDTAIATNQPQSAEFRIVHPDGSIRHIQTNVKVQLNQDGEPTIATGVNRDITMQKIAEQKLMESRERLQNILENLPIGAVYVKGNQVTINARAEEITGYHRGQLDNMDKCFEYLLHYDNYRVKTIYQKIRHRKTLPKSMKVRIYRSDDQIRWIDLSGCKIDDGEAWILKDITEQRRAEIELKTLAYYDQLTKLPNRSATEKRLSEALARAQRENIKVAVLLIDIDHFKNVNDIYGHPSGDRLLVEVASKLSGRVRQNDILGRIGGDEFMLIVENAGDETHLMSLAQALVDSCADPIELENNIFISAQISVGVSVYPSHGDDAVRLFRNADTALYKAKSKGRHTYQMYEDSFTRALENRLTMEQRLERAIEREEFAVFYQPIVDTKLKKIVGAESLLRWNDPDLGPVSPADFIPVAEESGLISHIGHWVLKNVCRQMAIWQDNKLPISSVSVNISSTQFADSDLFEQVKQAIDDAQLDPRLLTLEITESILMQNKTSTKHALLRLRGIGVGLAIDDFGTGYSSLAYLKYFAVNTLKIDRSFIRDVPSNYDDVQITEAIISMAKKLKLQVVAEGVETKEQLKFIEQCGCDSFQGFIVSPAVPALEFSKLLGSLH